jgi:hypothetical protein
LEVDAVDEQDLRILGKLPQLSFLFLVVHSIAEVDCNNNTTTGDDAGCLFQKLRSCQVRRTPAAAFRFLCILLELL